MYCRRNSCICNALTGFVQFTDFYAACVSCDFRYCTGDDHSTVNSDVFNNKLEGTAVTKISSLCIMTVFVPYVCLEQYAFMFYIFPSFHAGAAMMEGTLQENIIKSCDEWSVAVDSDKEIDETGLMKSDTVIRSHKTGKTSLGSK